MPDAPKKGFLSSSFFKAAAKYTLKLALWTLPIFLGVTFGTEIVSFLWGHESTGGIDLISALRHPVLDFFNYSGINQASHDAADWIRETFNTSAVADAKGYADTALDIYNNAPFPQQQ